MTHPIDGPWLKIDRAEIHLKSLEERVQGFLNSNPYAVVNDLDPQTGEHVLRASIRAAVPAEWSAIIGDIAHNLRSALDLLVWQMALLRTNSPYGKTAFPIFDVFAKYRDNGRVIIQNLTPRQKALIKRLQPYQRGSRAQSHPLWLLHDINNSDKHRVIQAVGTVLSFSGLGINELWGFNILNMSVGGGGQRVEEGAELARFRLVQTAPQARVQMNPDFAFNIEFGEGSPSVEGMPLLPTLFEIFGHVERVVGMFDRRFL